MARNDLIQVEGTITDVSKGDRYTVTLTDNDVQVFAKLCGKMRRHHIRVVTGDRVTVGCPHMTALMVSSHFATGNTGCLPRMSYTSSPKEAVTNQRQPA